MAHVLLLGFDHVQAERCGNLATSGHDRLVAICSARAEKSLDVGIKTQALDRDLGFVDRAMCEYSTRFIVEYLIRAALFLPSAVNLNGMIDQVDAEITDGAKSSRESRRR
jgi:hypothetical protein